MAFSGLPRDAATSLPFDHRSCGKRSRKFNAECCGGKIRDATPQKMCTHPFEVGCVIPDDEVDSSAPPTIKKDHRIWTEFKTAWEADKLKDAPVLDFSYAGFDHGETEIPPASGRTFDVTTFGAIPDDLEDDRPAVKLAIEAATTWRNQRPQMDDTMAIVFFPPGKFLLGHVEHEYDTLKIEGDYIVIKGSGSGGPLATVLDVKFSPAPEAAAANAGSQSFLLNWRVKAPALFTFQRTLSKGTAVVTNITKNAKKGDTVIYVDDASKIREAANTDHSQHTRRGAGAGGQIWLKLDETHKANSRLLAGLSVDSKWQADNYLTENHLSGPKAQGMPIKERHQVDEIPSNQNTMIRLKEPLMCDVYAKDGWWVGLDGLTPGWGVEDLRLDGGWDEGNEFLDNGEFSHHFNWVSDLGWQMIKFEYGFQPYVRRTLIKDVTGKPITFENCFGGSLAWSKWYGSAAPLRQPTTPEVCLLRVA